MEYEQDPDYDFLRKKFQDVLKGLNEEMDYIYDWTTSTDLKKRANKKDEENDENESGENDIKKEENDLESNKNDQMDRIATREIKRKTTIENNTKERQGEDKVESVCCKM